jgi:hypothetical protein
MHLSLQCLLLGHDDMMVRGPARLALQCNHCGRETAGWTLAPNLSAPCLLDSIDWTVRGDGESIRRSAIEVEAGDGYERFVRAAAARTIGAWARPAVLSGVARLWDRGPGPVRNGERERRAGTVVERRPQAPAMILDDGAAH